MVAFAAPLATNLRTVNLARSLPPLACNRIKAAVSNPAIKNTKSTPARQRALRAMPYYKKAVEFRSWQEKAET